MTALLLAVCSGTASASAADEYVYDAVHSSVSFKARHLDLSWIHGRFNEVDGRFSIDRQDASKSSFQLTIKADSVDTANAAAMSICVSRTTLTPNNSRRSSFAAKK
ncbi:MAG UNVERIFIED_CONTAM: YceI family protein [Planctomycetaceae bacterium]